MTGEGRGETWSIVVGEATLASNIGGKGSNGEKAPGVGMWWGNAPRAIGQVKPSLSLTELSRRVLVLFTSWLVLVDLPRGGGVRCAEEVEEAATDFRFDFISTSLTGLAVGDSFAKNADVRPVFCNASSALCRWSSCSV